MRKATTRPLKQLRTVGLIALVALPAASAGCSESDQAAVKPPELHAVREAQIDPAVQPTASEFAGRLKQNGGQLLALSRTGDTLHARWTSGKCDYFEPEVIDLLISVNRTIKESPTITGERDCDGASRPFSIDGSRFQQYRTGKVNDSQVLAGLK